MFGLWGSAAPVAPEYPEIPTPKSDADYSTIAEEARTMLYDLISNKEGWETATSPVPDVELLLKTVEGSPAKISRAEGEIAFGLDKIMEVAESTDSAKWLAHEADLADWQVVNTVDEAARVFVVYSAHKTPFPVTHRELLYVRKTHRFPDGRIMIVGKSINDPQQMAREGRVRAVVLAGWLFTPIDENKTRVVRIIQLDPKGNIPAFLINTHNEKTARAIPLLASQIH